MISVSDILKLLEQIPVWKTISALPKRIEALEARVAQLEASKSARPENKCAICGEATRVVRETAHPVFGQMGVKIHELECPNGHKSSRDFNPR